LYVFSKPEICTSAELAFIPEGVPELATVSSDDANVRILTQPFPVDDPLVLDALANADRHSGVGRTPVAADIHTRLTDYFYDLFGSPAQHAAPQGSR